MNKENLQCLIEAYNLLWNLSATGASIIPMGLAMKKLQAVIADMATALSDNDNNETASVSSGEGTLTSPEKAVLA